MNAAKTFSPRAAQELGANGLRLVVEGVRRGHRIRFSRSHQLPEPAVAQPPRRLFNRLTCVGRFSLGVDLRCVDGQPKIASQGLDELLVRIGFRAAQAVVQMDRAEHQAQLADALLERAQQGHRVRPAGDPHRQPKTWPEQGCIYGQSWSDSRAHLRIIVCPRQHQRDCLQSGQVVSSKACASA